MDYQMPGMDGLEAGRIIKRDDRLKHVPKIVMVTAFGREDSDQAEEIGIESYLLKPVNLRCSTTPSWICLAWRERRRTFPQERMTPPA